MAEETVTSSSRLTEDIPGEGAGRCVSFAVEQPPSRQGQQEGDAPVEITSATGVKFTVITDDDIADENRDKRTCCRKFLFVFAVLFVLPIIHVFGDIIPMVVQNMDDEVGVLPPLGRPTSRDQSKFQDVIDTYNKVHNLFGIISGILIAVCNYRVTAILGCCISGSACLVASFLPVNKYAMVFLLGVLPGVGNNLVTVSVTVAILEYFRGKRLLVLSFSTASVFLSTIVHLFIQIFLFPKVGINTKSSYLQYQAATYVVAIGGALLLTPLNLHMKDVPRDSVRSRMLNITASGLEMLKSPAIYLLATVFLFDSLGRTIPGYYFGYFREGPRAMVPVHGLATMLTGLILGCMVSCCLSRKCLSMRLSLILITAFGFVMGALTLSVEPVDQRAYDFVYGLLYGALVGLRIPLMTLAIPLVLGEDHLSLSVGVINFATGMGGIIGTESTGAIIENHRWLDAVFYMSGLAFVASGIACVILTKLKWKETSKTCASGGERDEPGKAREGRCT